MAKGQTESKGLQEIIYYRRACQISRLCNDLLYGKFFIL